MHLQPLKKIVSHFLKASACVLFFIMFSLFFFAGTASVADASVRVATSSPARVSALTTATTASFTPGNNALLLAMVSADAPSATAVTITMSNNGTALTWTNIATRDPGDAGAQDGHASAWYAILPASRSLTVSAGSD